MAKKINLIFDEDVFQRMKESKGEETFAEYLSGLVLEAGDEQGDVGEGVGTDDDGGESLSVSSEKLFGILNAINERFNYFSQLTGRIENLERAVEVLSQSVESGERAAFEGREGVERMKELLAHLGTRWEVMDGSGPSSDASQDPATDPREHKGYDNYETYPEEEEEFEFGCPNCDGSVDENDYFCRWCSFQLVEGESTVAFRDQYYRESDNSPYAAGSAPYDKGTERDNSGFSWESGERVPPSSRPPPEWDDRKVELDSSGCPICPKCIQSMTYVSEYERWFCEVCWYYAPLDYLRQSSGVSREEKGTRSLRRPDGRKGDPNRKWDSKKLGELPLFRKKRDRQRR